jgi:uncharacterized protein (TIGR03435 family)
MFWRTSVVLLLITVVAAGHAQAPGKKMDASSMPVRPKPLSFGVVSIKPSDLEHPGGRMGFGLTPTGYWSGRSPLVRTILMAYYPFKQGTPERLKGVPNWVTKDLFDIEARVGEADMPAWESAKQNLQHKPMLEQMLQTMLAERCKLVVHRVPVQVEGWALVVARGGRKFSEAPPNEELPKGVILADGGVMVFTGADRRHVEWTYHSAPIASLIYELTIGGRPIVDRTGLTGKYQFVLKQIDMTPEQNGLVSSEETNPANVWDLGALGLKLEPIKVPSQNIVIDHIERPTEN